MVMWPFNKTYYADDWELVDSSFIKVLGDIGEHTGWALKVFMRNRQTGKPKRVYVGRFYSYLSIDEIKDKLFSRHGIILDLEKNQISLPRKPYDPSF